MNVPLENTSFSNVLFRKVSFAAELLFRNTPGFGHPCSVPLVAVLLSEVSPEMFADILFEKSEFDKFLEACMPTRYFFKSCKSLC